MNGRQKSLWIGLLLGLAAAAFFSVSFVLNRKMADAAGHWAWSASLRFLMMIPVLTLVISIRRQWGRFREMWQISPAGWIAWGSLGCGVFYATLTAACSVSPAWVVAATWPVAIVIGILLGPWLYDDHRKKIPRLALLYSIIIVAGVVLLQTGQFQSGNAGNVVLGITLVLASASAHPLGNRKSMNLIENSGMPSDALLRLSLMTLGSLPLLGLLCLWGYMEAGPPPPDQLSTVAIVAAAGLIATPLFYMATDRVNRDAASLAAVEATQAAEILFTLMLEAWLIGIPLPDTWGALGITLIIGGILLHARPPSHYPRAY